MSESTRDMLREQLESTREHLDELWARIDGPDPIFNNYTDDPDDIVTGDEAHEELDELPLEIVWEKGEPFAVVLGTGGPHIEIRGGTRHDGMAYRLVGYWAGERVELFDRWDQPANGPVERTGMYFRELVEETDQ